MTYPQCQRPPSAPTALAWSGRVRFDLWVMTTNHPHFSVNSPAIVEILAGCFLLCGPSALPLGLMKV